MYLGALVDQHADDVVLDAAVDRKDLDVVALAEHASFGHRHFRHEVPCVGIDESAVVGVGEEDLLVAWNTVLRWDDGREGDETFACTQVKLEVRDNERAWKFRMGCLTDD